MEILLKEVKTQGPTLETAFPFGKYKGAPLASVLLDREYVHWLMAQAFFVEKFPAFLVAMKNGVQPSEQDCTPEHNEMQLRFLDQKVIEACAASYLYVFFPEYDRLKKLEFEKPKFELGNWDVIFDFWSRCEVDDYYISLKIELKPLIGDDYPAILRKIISRINGQQRSRRSKAMVICDKFESQVASIEQVKKIYAAAEVVLVTWEDVVSQMF